MENPNSLNKSNEAIPEVNLVIPEPNHVGDAHDPNEMVDIPDDEELVDYDGDDEEEPEEEPKEEPKEEPEEELEPNIGHEDQFAQHPNPQPGNMNGWLEEDDDMNENVNDEDIQDEDVEIEVDEEAELIFPYEVEGDQTPPPPAESSDSKPPIAEPPNTESSDSISFCSETEGGRVIAARDSSHVSGLEPWALRRDLEATRTRARLIEAEIGTNRTETALLDSQIKIGEKERKILNHDLGNVEKTLGNVVERLKILECGENATLKKKLKDKEMQLVIARMDRASAERRLHESIGWNRRFYLEMVRKGAVPKPPSDDEDDGRSRKKLKKSDKDDGPVEPRGPPSDSR
ncbi:hypothetical protein Tco_0676447 [Tanacetum coccineum]